jgi:hypothetical protein
VKRTVGGAASFYTLAAALFTNKTSSKFIQRFTPANVKSHLPMAFCFITLTYISVKPYKKYLKAVS